MNLATRNAHRLLSSFASDRRGNIAVIFALSLLPILSFIGAAIDYSMATRAKTKLTSALDTAVLVATAKSEITKSASTAQSDAQNAFTGQLAALSMSSTS